MKTLPGYSKSPPTLPPLKRQILLAQTILKLPDYAKSFDQALLLAAALGRLMDHVYTEGLDLQKLPSLVSAERLAEHWQGHPHFHENPQPALARNSGRARRHRRG
jgi:inactivated superfamily I helicase